MKNEIRTLNESIIARSYADNYGQVFRFISQRVNNVADAENLTQDVWLKLLECDKPLNDDTLKSFIYTIARNLVNDYLRHLYIAQEVHGEILKGTSIFASDLESEVSARDLASHEVERVKCLPQQRRIIYVMSRYDEKSIEEIAEALSLSNRTVENHLRLGRRDVRSYVTAIA